MAFAATVDLFRGNSPFGGSRQELKLRAPTDVSSSSNTVIQTSVPVRPAFDLTGWAELFVYPDTDHLDFARRVLELWNQDRRWSREVAGVVTKLVAFDQNWNGTDGQPPTLREASRMLGLLSRIAAFVDERPFLYPSPRGGMVAEFRLGATTVTVLVEGTVGMVGASPSTKEGPTFIDMTLPDGEAALIDEVAALAAV